MDQPLERERPRTRLVHLYHCLGVVVQYADSFAELWFESGSLENCRQKLMVQPIEGFGLIQINRHSVFSTL